MSDDSTPIEPTVVQTGAEVAAEQDAHLPAATGDGEDGGMTWGQAILGILNFATLALRVMALAAAAALLKERLHLLKERMHHDAARGRRLSEQLSQAGADGTFQAQALEVAAAFERVAQASGELAGAADQMEANAQAVKGAHDSEYRGIHEVTNASPYLQPKAGFNEVR